MSIQSDTPETYSAWKVFEAGNDIMPLLRQSIKGERERNDLRQLVKKLEGQLTSALDEIVKAHDQKQPTRETPDKLD